MLKQYYEQNGWDKYIEYDKLNKVEEYISNISQIKYLNHGGTCIAFMKEIKESFSNSDPIVIKICIIF
jgi:hypothetical protein